MRAATVFLVLLCFHPRFAPAQQPADTTTVLQGFLQANGSTGWVIVPPLAVEALGRRTFVVPLAGEGGRWRKFASRFVEASGHLGRNADTLVLDAQHMKEVDPARTAHATYDRGVTRHARISLSVIPNRIAWSDSSGRSTGVNPTVLYVIKNERTAPIYIVLSTNDLICLTVQGNASAWDTTTFAPVPNYHRFVIQHGGEFRQALQLPPDAAPRPGRYMARIGICQLDDYDVSTEFAVVRE